MSLGDVKDLVILGALGIGAYYVYKLLKTGPEDVVAGALQGVYETNVVVRSDIVARREEFGYAPGSISPGWLGEPPSGSAGMKVYADRIAALWATR